jgi:hypothetical protein
MWMILRPSSVSTTSSPSPTGAGANAGGGSAFGGSGAKADVLRIREIGGRIVRFISSLGARLGFGVCGSMSETLSTGGFETVASGAACLLA